MFVRVSVLFLVCVLCLQWIAAKRGSKGRDRKKPVKLPGGSEIEDLKEAVAKIHERLEDGGGGESCNSNVHFFFHSGDEDHHQESHDDDDQHVHLHLHHDRRDHDQDGHHDPHSEGDSVHTAHCEFHDKDSGVRGYAYFVQQNQDHRVNIEFGFEHLGAADSEYAVHIHEFGDLSNGCNSIGGHYDPYDDTIDVGDLGTLMTDSDGTVQSVWKNDTHVTLLTRYSIAGRSVAVHGVDGSKIGCCVIGWGTVGEHDHHEHHDDHIDHHSEDHDDHHDNHNEHHGKRKHEHH